MIFRYIFQSACQIEKYELQYLCYKTKLIKEFYRGMAQFGSALDWGSRGHGFKSRYSDQETMRVPLHSHFYIQSQPLRSKNG